MSNEVVWWIGFNVAVLLLLALDLGVFHRKSHVVGIKESLIWSVVWTVLALLFNVWVYYWRGKDAGLAFFTGYLIERSLSMDNIFVFYLIFTYFAVPPAYQHKVLFWGILSALVMRAFFILVGVTLVNRFEWIIYVFGAFLVVTGIRMGMAKEKEIHPEKNPILRLLRRVLPTTRDFQGDRFYVIKEGQFCTTPLFVVLLIVETTDLIFAIDSIPAILAITTDPFIVYTSNVLAILGLRALYFALASVTAMFEYLHYGLSVILVYVGVKMLLAHVYPIPIGISLAFICGVLLLSVVLSISRSRRRPDTET